jgi:putative ABC transport system permease protein
MLMVVSERTREIGHAQGARGAQARHHLADPDRVGHKRCRPSAASSAPWLGFGLAVIISKLSPLPGLGRGLVGGGRASASPRHRRLSSASIRRCGPAARLGSDRSTEARNERHLRSGLLGEIVVDARSTRCAPSKMRSALTVLGVVIGITSIVGMTSLIRGFGRFAARLDPPARAEATVFVQKIRARSSPRAAARRSSSSPSGPNSTRSTTPRAIARDCPSERGDRRLARGRCGSDRSRIYYGHEKTTQVPIIGATENFSAVNFIKLELGRLFTPGEVDHRRQVVVLGQNPYKSLFPNVDPIGKKVRIGANEFTVIGVFGKRPSPAGFGGADDFVVIPFTAQEKFFGKVVKKGYTGGNIGPAAFRSAMIAVVPREGATREQAMAEAEAVMRIRHNLKLDEPNDFDLATQDAVLKVWDQISQATFLALVVISSIALMVGGIGVMAIMMISVTERTREIGVRKALGARRREILWQFLIEAAFLTSLAACSASSSAAASAWSCTGCRASRLAAVVVVRAGDRLLRQRRHLLRTVPRVQGVALGPSSARYE